MILEWWILDLRKTKITSKNNRFESFSSLKMMNLKGLMAFGHDVGKDFDFDNPNKDKTRMADTKFENDDIENK